MVALAKRHDNASIGKALRKRLDETSQPRPKLMTDLLAELEAPSPQQGTRNLKQSRETGQEIANRAGLFSGGAAVKRRVGI